MLGCRARQILLIYLHVIELHCIEERLPPLASIVKDAPRLRPLRNDVNADIYVDPEKLLRQVFEYRWFDSSPPSASDVRELRAQIREAEVDVARRAKEPQEPPPPSERRLTSRVLQQYVSEQLDVPRRRSRAPKPRAAKATLKHPAVVSAPKPKRRRSSAAAKAKPTPPGVVSAPKPKKRRSSAAAKAKPTHLRLVSPPKSNPKAKKSRPT